MTTTNICVFCGSAPGTDAAYSELTVALGIALAKADIGLVYGGASIGLMGLVADTVLQAGGSVIGVIPESLRDREIAHDNLTELHVVADMHERKKKMYELSAGFVALPGGYGTFEEVFESATWSQLGLHTNAVVKPVVLLDAADYWQPLAAFLDASVTAGFVKPDNRPLIERSTDVDDALSRIHPGLSKGK